MVPRGADVAGARAVVARSARCPGVVLGARWLPGSGSGASGAGAGVRSADEAGADRT